MTDERPAVEKLLEIEKRRRKQAEKKAARANEENIRLRKLVRDYDWAYRSLKSRYDNDESSARKLKVLEDRLNLIAELTASYNRTEEPITTGSSIPKGPQFV